MTIELGADIEARALDETALHEIERHEDAPDAAVAIEEGVDDFELGVEDGRLDERVFVDGLGVGGQIFEGVGELGGRGRNEPSAFEAGAGPTDPVLAGAECAWSLIGARTPDIRIGEWRG